MKRILTIVLALMLVLSCTAFVASAEAEKKLSVLTIAAGASFPDGVTVGTSDYLQKIEELTGFDLEWTNFTDASTDGLMLMMTSGNTPDLIQYASGAPLVDLANSGAIAPLNNSLEKNGQGLLELLPQDVIDMGTIDGNIYFLPRYTGGGQLGTITIRKDVLDKLGLGIPKTIEDYDVVFQTVKEQTDLTPLMLQSGRSSFMLFASALGVDFTRNTYFYVVNDECTIPVLTEKGQAFIEKMHEWYVAGYIDPEYLMDSEVISKFLAGSGFATFLDYTQIARQVPTFYEKNPDAELIYIDPPVGANGETGYTVDGTTSMAWFVPAANANKADLAIEFLNACLDEKVLNLICYGIEGENWEYVDGVPTFIEGNFPVDYRGYYSRVVLDRTWDEAWEASMGITELCEQLQGYRKFNEILYLPPVGVEAYAEHNAEISSFINDEVNRMIVEGTNEQAIAEVFEKVLELGGDKVIDQVNAWLRSK